MKLNVVKISTTQFYFLRSKLQKHDLRSGLQNTQDVINN